MNIAYFLIIVLSGGGGAPAITTLPEPFAAEQACKLAGEAWKIEAVQGKERAPRYYCIAVEGRLE